MSQRLASLLWIALFLATLTGVPPGSSFGNDTALEQLREVQSKVQRVVQDTLPACVAISDGIGFGSGVVVNSSGHILTAGHVVNTGTQKLDVYFPDGRIVRARLLGYNLNVDAAMIQIIDPGPWPHVPVATSTEHLQSGDWLVSLGHSGGYEVGRNPPVRSGRLLERRGHQLVTDAVLIGGDSGGPLFDLNGQL
ncbi:MAG TPA: serine protease, partial [Pirellulaceae bacterium]|nr:serine protease [Pirellulaceae bacterium]